VRGDDLATQAAAIAAPWGGSLELLPLDAEERAGLGRELAALAAHRRAIAIRRFDGATKPTNQDPFLAAEHRRLASVAHFAVPGCYAAPDRDALLDAVALYRLSLDRDPAHYWARFQLARCYLALGRVAESVETFSACIALRPQAPWGYSARALALALSRRFEDAHRDLDRALAAAPDSLPARLNRGLVYRLQDEPARAAAEFDALLALPHPLPEAAFYRAQLLLRDDRAQAAFELLDRVATDHPKFMPAHVLSVQALLALDRPADAVAELDQVIRSSATSGNIAGARGHLLRLLIPQLPRKRQRAAIALADTQLSDATRSDAGDAGDAAAYADLGAIRHLRGDFAAAVAAYSSAAALNADDPQILIDRGWSLEGLDQLYDARSDFAQALARRPTSAEALAGLGYVEARLRQSAEAQRHADLAVLQAGNDHLILHNVACIYARLADNNLSTARAHEDAAIALLARAVQIWRTTRSGPSERELIQLEAAFGTSLRARAEFRALQQ
jgi:tetratricopeptide (TPR) repeat protein